MVHAKVERVVRLEAVLAQDTRVASPAAFEEFFELEHERLLRALYLVTGNRHEAEDVMQDAFVRILERWDSVQWMDDPTAYLYRTAMNAFRTRYRRGLMALRRMAVFAPRQVDLFAEVEVNDEVRSALASLSPRQRAAIVLTELLGYTSAEAGQIMGIQGSTVRALSTQARERAKTAVERHR